MEGAVGERGGSGGGREGEDGGGGTEVAPGWWHGGLKVVERFLLEVVRRSWKVGR